MNQRLKNLILLLTGLVSFLLLIVLANRLIKSELVDLRNLNNTTKNTVPNNQTNSDLVQKECIVTGCSGQICEEKTSESPTITDCTYKEEYKCYQFSTCRIQRNGECGWTESKEFKACLLNYLPEMHKNEKK